MGKSQSKSDEGEVYVVSPLPVAYDLETAAQRPLSPSRSVVVLHPSGQKATTTTTTGRAIRRSLSLHSLRDRSGKMASSKWRSAGVRKDVLDRKAFYLGRYQAKAVNEATLATLRRSLRQAKQRKTRIKMSPLGFSFGTKPGGLLTTDKVAYQFVPLEDIESLLLDAVIRDVLLCVVRIERGRDGVQNGQVDSAVAQHYEISAFHVDPRDAVLFQRAHSEFKSRGVPAVHQQATEREASLKARPLADVRLPSDDAGWTTARGDQARALGPSRSERDVRRQNHGGAAYRRSSFDLADGGVPPNFDGLQRFRRRRDAATDPRYPATARERKLTPSSGHSMATRVYFHRNVPMADVECQLSPPPEDTAASRGAFQTTTTTTTTTRSNSERNTEKRDSVKRQMRHLSREVDQLRTMLESSDDDDEPWAHSDVDGTAESGVRIAESGVRSAGVRTRLNSPSRTIMNQNLAGTIDTRLGKVDVVVDEPPPRRAAVGRRRNPDGYASDVQPSASHHRRNGHVLRRASDRSGVSTEIAGRYVYYRPVSSDVRTTHTFDRTAYVRPGSKKQWIVM